MSFTVIQYSVLGSEIGENDYSWLKGTYETNVHEQSKGYILELNSQLDGTIAFVNSVCEDVENNKMKPICYYKSNGNPDEEIELVKVEVEEGMKKANEIKQSVFILKGTDLYFKSFTKVFSKNEIEYRSERFSLLKKIESQFQEIALNKKVSSKDASKNLE